MTQKVRRVVTGHDKQGKSIIISDGIASNIDRPLPVAPDNALINLWVTDSAPASYQETDTVAKTVPLAPPSQGTILRFVDFPPDSTFVGKLDARVIEKTWSNLSSNQQESQKGAPHPLMHKTKTIDYIIVLSGEVYLVLDQTETLLKPGDVVIQRGTNHAWSNRCNTICRVAAVLIDAE